MQDSGRRLLSGALSGMQVFFSYAFAEHTLLVLSLILKPALLNQAASTMLAPQWRGTVILLVAYQIAGAFLGAAFALVTMRAGFDPPRIRKALILTVLLAFAVNSGLVIHTVPAKLALVISALLIAGGTYFGLGGSDRRPWLAFGILMVSTWLNCSDRVSFRPAVVTVPLAIVSVAVFFCLVAVGERLFSWVRAQRGPFPLVLHAVKIAAILLVSVGVVIPSAEVEGKVPAASWAALPRSSRPNIILITLDTVRADHMGIYGYSRANTPHLQEFLKTSTLYANVIATAPITLSSHASIFTGLYPQSHGAYLSRPLVPQIPTLAQLLTENGYRTTAIVANKYFLRREFHTLHGFHIKQRLVPMNLVHSGHDYLLRNRLRDLLRIDSVRRDLDNDTVTGDEINQDAFSSLDEFRQGNSPFFLFLNYMDAHAPYLPSAPYDSMYAGLDFGFTPRDYSRMEDEVNGSNRPVPTNARAHMVSQYDGAIAELDQRIQELVDHLKANGQFDHTMIIISSDHGEALGDRNVLFHNSTVYQDQVHIPLVVKYPGQHQPEREDAIVSNVDLMPTVLNAVGIALPPGLEGFDLRQIPPGRVVVAEMRGNQDLHPRFQRSAWALYWSKYKMIYGTDGTRELYDLSADPGELHNLYQMDAPITAQMRESLVDWSRRTLPRYLDVGPANRFVDERLKSLGYAHQGVE